MKYKVEKDVHVELYENDPFKNHSHITLLEGPYSGVTYRYGDVKLEEQDKQLSIVFHYDIIDGEHPEDESKFSQYIGDILLDILGEQMREQSLVYAGGSD